MAFNMPLDLISLIGRHPCFDRHRQEERES